jgi:hypothetical protein
LAAESYALELSKIFNGQPAMIDVALCGMVNRIN